MLGAATLAATRSLAFGQQPNAPDRPNVLFLAFDDLNDWIGPLGGYPGTGPYSEFRPPGFARRGVHERECAAPVCNASRASLLTGVQPVHLRRLRQQRAVARGARSARRCDACLIASESAATERWEAGRFFTRSPGSTTITEPARTTRPPGTITSRPSTNRCPSRASPPPRRNSAPTRAGASNGRAWPPATASAPTSVSRITWTGVPLPPSKDKYADEQVVDWAVGELRKSQTKPLFLGVGIFKPHIPWFVPQEYYDLYPLDKVMTPPVREWRKGLPPAAQAMGEERRQWHYWIVANGDWANAVQGYLAAIAFADAQLGRLLDALDASRYAKDTIVVLWGDNGFQLGERETWEKFTLWEESDRIPLMFVAPGVDQTGRPLFAGSQPPGYLSHAGRPDATPTPPEAQKLEGHQPGAAAEEPECKTDRAGHHQFRSRQSLDSHGTLPLHPLQERRRRTLRSRNGSRRVSQPRGRSEVRQAEGGAGKVGAERRGVADRSCTPIASS